MITDTSVIEHAARNTAAAPVGHHEPLRIGTEAWQKMPIVIHVVFGALGVNFRLSGAMFGALSVIFGSRGMFGTLGPLDVMCGPPFWGFLGDLQIPH